MNSLLLLYLRLYHRPHPRDWTSPTTDAAAVDPDAMTKSLSTGGSTYAPYTYTIDRRLPPSPRGQTHQYILLGIQTLPVPACCMTQTFQVQTLFSMLGKCGRSSFQPLMDKEVVSLMIHRLRDGSAPAGATSLAGTIYCTTECFHDD